MPERVVSTVEEEWNNAAAGRVINPLSLRRSIVELLSAGIENKGLWADVPGETEHGKHAVRVARVALAIGRRSISPIRACKTSGSRR